MGGIEAALNDIGVFDRLSLLDTPVHRLDPRAKIFVTAAFVAVAASFGKHDIAALTPMCLYPAVMIAAGRLPLALLAQYVALASPFALLVGIWNPVFDREIAYSAGPLALSGGTLSFLSIMLKFALTATAALILLATTGYVAICSAAGRLGLPRALVAQFLFLYRYLFVLSREAARMRLAHSLRSGGRAIKLREWIPLAGHLLLRSLDRGNRIYMAMSCRGFDGEIRTARRLSFAASDFAFAAGWCAFFLAARCRNIPELVGEIVLRGIG